MLATPSTPIYGAPSSCTTYSARRSARLKPTTPGIEPSRRNTRRTLASGSAPKLFNKPQSKKITDTVIRDGLRPGSPSSQIKSVSTASTDGGGSRSSSWSAKDDEILISARAQGLNWTQISPQHFPQKSANACRKRHERLMERQNAEQWDGVKLDILAQAYMDVRREMWSILAARVGEKWTLLEEKCMEKGLKNVAQASRSAQRRQKDGTYIEIGSGIGISDSDEEQFPNALETISVSQQARYPHYRIPSIQSMMNAVRGDSSQSVDSCSSEVMRDQNRPHTQLPSSAVPASAAHSTSHIDCGQMTDKGCKTSTGNSREDEVLRSSERATSEEIVLQEDVPVSSEGDSHTPQRTAGVLYTSDANSSVSHSEDQIQFPTMSSRRSSDSTLPQASSAAQEQSVGVSSASNCSEDEAVDMSEVSLEESTPGRINDLDTQKEQILDRLMVHFYELFAVHTFSTRNGTGSSTPSGTSQQIDSSSGHGSRSTRKKRKSDEMAGDENEDEDEADKPGKRPRRPVSSTRRESETGRRLACPYYKHDHRRHYPSGACSGPGWLTIPRVKEHLYREHAMPLHCRRCYLVFENESQMTEHSRLADGCEMRDARLVEGFNKDQEEKLKDKSRMHRAKTDENKWKLVYLILFPNTAPSALPSPYYDAEIESSVTQLESASPKAPELKEFEAFMNRELPRQVRKALETTMETMFGNIEETLKTRLENIVRDCHETLSKSFLDTAKRLTSCSGGPSGTKKSTFPAHPACVNGTSSSSSSKEINTTENVLSQHLVPSESAPDPWPPEFIDAMNYNAPRPTWSDSAYLSHSDLSGDSFSLLQMVPAPDLLTTSANAEEFQFAPTNYVENETSNNYLGKGKGRAINHTSTTNYGI